MASFQIYRRGRVWLALGVIALYQAMIFAAFSYFAPLLTETDGLPSSWVPGVLALFGIGALLGISLGGRLADLRPIATLYGSIALALAALAVLASTTGTTLAVIAVFVFGAAGFAANPALNVRTYVVAGDAPTLAGASTTSAFNVGNTAGPALGGLAIDAGLGFPSVAWVGIALGAATLAVLTVSATIQRPDDREPVAV